MSQYSFDPLDCPFCLEVSIKAAAYETTLQCDQCGSILEFQGTPDKPDAGALPCAMCFEVATELALLENPAAWMRCDDCHNIVTISAETVAAVAKKPNPRAELSALQCIMEEMAMGFAPSHFWEQLHKIMHYSPRDGDVLQWMLSRASKRAGSNAFADAGMKFASIEQSSKWKREGDVGTEAAKRLGKTILDSATDAWARRWPRIPRKIQEQSHLGAKDYGRSILVFDLSCYDNSDWVSWKRIKKMLRNLDRLASQRQTIASNTATGVSTVSDLIKTQQS